MYIVYCTGTSLVIPMEILGAHLDVVVYGVLLIVISFCPGMIEWCVNAYVMPSNTIITVNVAQELNRVVITFSY